MVRIHKDPLPVLTNKNVVYKISCKDCDASQMCGTNFQTTDNEDFGTPQSHKQEYGNCVCDHRRSCHRLQYNHEFNWNDKNFIITNHYINLFVITGLFHKAISQSGVMACPWAFTEREPHTKNRGFLLAEKLGKPTTDPKVAYEFLKTIDAKKLIETQEKSLLSEAERQQCLLTFTPTLDYESSNPAFPENLTTFIHRGVNVPLLLGFTSCEGSLFICSNFMNHTSKEELKKIDSDFKMIIMPKILSTLSKIPMTVKELRSIYFGDKAVSEETLINYANFIGDQFFYRSIMEVTDIQAELNTDNTDNNATYLYKFSYENETNFMRKLLNITLPGVSHGEDLPYLFYPNMMKDLGLSPPAPDSEDYKMINCLTQMWTDFAKTGYYRV
ncbi:juvenile hormone esterase-like [Pogonomyrmex barbatus]|uniref:Juvenile hormone esterase-like n=1 Tax=Pogonomyrmex barbatus TaxID=144034 RepID=A0A6I9VYR5_9HYME|nr:juvenile hormone esterase-like [Pogonomyrmex barbatus]